MVDLSPLYGFANSIIDPLLQVLAIAATGWIVFAFHRYIAPYLGSQYEAQLAANLNTALTNGTAAALVKLQAAESAHKDLAVQGAVQRMAVQYAINHAPQAIAHFGLSEDALLNKALAFIPTPPPSSAGTTGAIIPTVPVQTETLPAAS